MTTMTTMTTMTKMTITIYNHIVTWTLDSIRNYCDVCVLYVHTCVCISTL